MEKEIQVFISYAKEDLEIAERLYYDLTNAGITAWIDTKYLVPGRNWRSAINNAIKTSNFFIALISKSSVNKVGFVQKELKIALDLLDEYPLNKTYIIPVRIDEIIPLDIRIKDIQWVDLFADYKNAIKKYFMLLFQKRILLLRIQ